MIKFKTFQSIIVIFLTLFSFAISGSENTELDKYKTDWASPQSIVDAMYNTLSADPGEERDWTRFRQLFFANAEVLMAIESPQFSGIMTQDVEQLISQTESAYKHTGFHEIQTAQKVTQLGNMASVYSSFEVKLKQSDAEPMMKGLNHFQLLFDGDRWWIISNTSILDSEKFEASSALQ